MFGHRFGAVGGGVNDFQSRTERLEALVQLFARHMGRHEVGEQHAIDDILGSLGIEQLQYLAARVRILERRADLAEGCAEALGLAGPKSLEEEIAELRAAEKVDAELEAMKAALAARVN